MLIAHANACNGNASESHIHLFADVSLCAQQDSTLHSLSDWCHICGLRASMGPKCALGGAICGRHELDSAADSQGELGAEMACLRGELQSAREIQSEQQREISRLRHELDFLSTAKVEHAAELKRLHNLLDSLNTVDVRCAGSQRTVEHVTIVAFPGYLLLLALHVCASMGTLVPMWV